MAYISDEEQDKKEGMNVLSPQDTQIQKSETPPVENANVQASGQEGDQPTVNKKNVGTGFTNLKKYTEANKPAATQMAKNITGNIQSQASNIGQQLQQKQDQYKQQIAKNQQQLGQAQQFGQQTLQKAAQGNVSADEAKRFQALTSGQESYANAPQLDLQKEQVAAQNLSKQIGNVSTDEGRASLLRNTFGNKGQQYTSGQQNLDRLILGGTADARKQVIQGLTGIDKPILQQAQQIGEAGQGMVSNLQAADLANREALIKQLGVAQTGTEKDIASAYEAAKTKGSSAQENMQKMLESVSAIQTKTPEMEAIERDIQRGSSGKMSDLGYAMNKQNNIAKLNNLVAQQNSGNAIQSLADKGIITKEQMPQIDAMIKQAGGKVNILDILKGNIGLQEGTAATRANVASEEQRARANALAQLSGAAQEFGVDPGQFKEATINLDLAKAQTDLNSKLAALGIIPPTTTQSNKPSLYDTLRPDANQAGQDFGNMLSSSNPLLTPGMSAQDRAKAVLLGVTAPSRAVLGQTLNAFDGTSEGITNLAKGNLLEGGQNLVDTATGLITSPYDAVSGLVSTVPVVGKPISNVISGATGAVKSIGGTAAKVGKSAKKTFKKVFSDQRMKSDISPAGNNIERLLELIKVSENEH